MPKMPCDWVFETWTMSIVNSIFWLYYVIHLPDRVCQNPWKWSHRSQVWYPSVWWCDTACVWKNWQRMICNWQHWNIWRVITQLVKKFRWCWHSVADPSSSFCVMCDNEYWSKYLIILLINHLQLKKLTLFWVLYINC
jgi:hypothetical protein